MMFKSLLNVLEMQRYQKRLSLLLFISAIFNAFPALIPLVAFYMPPHECDLYDVTGHNMSEINASNATLDFFLPTETNAIGISKRSRCYHYDRSWQDFIDFNSSTSTNITSFSSEKVLCKNHNFYFESGESSAAVDLNMYCANEGRKSLSILLYMCGMFTGSVSSGYLSDRYTKPTFRFHFHFTSAPLAFLFL